MPLTKWSEQHPRLASFHLLCAVAAAGTALAFFRIPGISARTVWAEDGRVFLQEYLNQGPGLLSPYDGYLHLLPRLIVALVTPLAGIESYAVAITFACSVVLGLVAALTFYCASALTASITARLCWAFIPILIAPGALETMGNAANLHWYLLWLVPWVLMKSPDTPAQQMMLGAAALIIALSEIQAALFLPMLLRQPGNRRLWPAKAALLTGVSCQLVSLWMFPRTRTGMGQDWDVLSVIYGYVLNSSAAIFYGSSSAIASHISLFGALPIALSAAPFAAVAVLVVRLPRGIQRTAGINWLLLSFVVWTAAVVINPAPHFHYSEYDSAGQWAHFFLSRYSTVPSMFLMAVVPLLITTSEHRRSSAGPRTPVTQTVLFRRGVIVAFLILQTVYFFPIGAAGSTGPVWSEGVQTAVLGCLADPARLEVQIPQAPSGWVTTVRCSDL